MPLILKIILIGIALAAVLFFLDKLFLKMEARGWIYYRKKQPSRTTLGNAFLEIQSMIEPGKRQIIETRKEIKDQQESGDDPVAGNENESNDPGPK
jgi:hypothetical protein